MVKLADALDSKSCGLIIRVGSSPTAGTNEKTALQNNRKVVFSYSRTSACLHADCCANMKKYGAKQRAMLLVSAVGGIA